ncbi:hypothetical protein AKJ16_DCAP13260 [Drosera capensis]
MELLHYPSLHPSLPRIPPLHRVFPLSINKPILPNSKTVTVAFTKSASSIGLLQLKSRGVERTCRRWRLQRRSIWVRLRMKLLLDFIVVLIYLIVILDFLNLGRIDLAT